MTSPNTAKPARLVAIDSLPAEMQPYALCDWATVAAVTGLRDVEHARETFLAAGLPVVHLSSKRKLPRWGVLRDFLISRERPATAAA